MSDVSCGYNMDSTDVVDEVNALLKLGVGDAYRLEHIKQSFIQNKNIWITDKNYLERLREKYLIKQTSEENEDNIVFENESENKETIHCWKCGKQTQLSANFCMICGTSLFEVGAKPQPISESKSPTKSAKPIPLKLPIIFVIPVIILIILGTAYSQGYFDGEFDSTSSNAVSTEIEKKDIFYGEYDSKCGAGTVLDPETNACRVGEVKPSNSGENDSKCGAGTVFDPKTNSCILE